MELFWKILSDLVIFCWAIICVRIISKDCFKTMRRINGKPVMVFDWGKILYVAVNFTVYVLMTLFLHWKFPNI